MASEESNRNAGKTVITFNVFYEKLRALLDEYKDSGDVISYLKCSISENIENDIDISFKVKTVVKCSIWMLFKNSDSGDV
jgi:hypothetical protein